MCLFTLWEWAILKWNLTSKRISIKQTSFLDSSMVSSISPLASDSSSAFYWLAKWALLSLMPYLWELQLSSTSWSQLAHSSSVQKFNKTYTYKQYYLLQASWSSDSSSSLHGQHYWHWLTNIWTWRNKERQWEYGQLMETLAILLDLRWQDCW